MTGDTQKLRLCTPICLATLFLNCLVVAIADLPAGAVPNELPKPQVVGPKPTPPVDIPRDIPQPPPEPPSSQIYTNPPPNSSPSYNPPPPQSTDTRPPQSTDTRPPQSTDMRPPQPVVYQGAVGCDEWRQIPVIRQINLETHVPCVLGENSYRYRGRPIHLYQFRSKAGEPVTIKLIGGKEGNWYLNPYLLLLGPNREIVAIDDNTNRQRIAQVDVRLPENGVYTILASNNAEAKQFGRYSLVLERDTKRYTFERVDELSDRSLRLRQDGSYYNVSEFQGEQDQFVTIRASSYSFFPVIYLIDPDGKVIAVNDNRVGARNAILEYRLTKSGTYQIVVNSLRPEDRGSYRLTMTTAR